MSKHFTLYDGQSANPIQTAVGDVLDLEINLHNGSPNQETRRIVLVLPDGTAFFQRVGDAAPNADINVHVSLQVTGPFRFAVQVYSGPTLTSQTSFIEVRA